MAAYREDNDMKIADGNIFRTEDKFDAMGFIEETKRQRFNGNTAKARQLGMNIVSSFSYNAAPDELISLATQYGVNVTPDILLQIKMLSVFSAEMCLNRYLPSPMLSSVAIGALYDVLDKVSSDFYSVLANSTAFSFYYMCVKLEGNMAENIGKCFAMLCGASDCEELSALGKALHELNISVYKKAINGVAFV